MMDRNRRPTWEDRLAPPMFVLSLLFLVVLAGLIHRFPRAETSNLERQLIVGLLSVLWLLFLPDAIYRFSIARPQVGFWPAFGRSLALCLAPPLRLAARSIQRQNQVWLPPDGWQLVDKELRRKLEKLFSIPMILIALMILPMLALEYVWYETAHAQPLLALGIDVGVSIIWLAFAIELIIMASVATGKLEYCVRHWVDLAIVLLPVAEVVVLMLEEAVNALQEDVVNALPVLRLLRLSRVLRLDMVTRFGRLYRLRGLAFRAWRAFLVLEIIQRLTGRGLEHRLRKLEELCRAKEDEVAELQQEIDRLKETIARQQVETVIEETEAAAVPVAVDVPPAPASEGEPSCRSGE